MKTAICRGWRAALLALIALLGISCAPRTIAPNGVMTRGEVLVVRGPDDSPIPPGLRADNVFRLTIAGCPLRPDSSSIYVDPAPPPGTERLELATAGHYLVVPRQSLQQRTRFVLEEFTSDGLRMIRVVATPRLGSISGQHLTLGINTEGCTASGAANRPFRLVRMSTDVPPSNQPRFGGTLPLTRVGNTAFYEARLRDLSVFAVSF